MIGVLLTVIIVYLVYKLHKQNKFIKEQFKKTKENQAKATYGNNLPPKKINTKKSLFYRKNSS